jgi:hypothetical protein
LIIDDILKVIYAPHKAFKSIVANPKYLGVMLVLILFMGLSTGYVYVQYSKTYVEQTIPTFDQLGAFTNATMKGNDNTTTVWRSSSNVALTNNFNDFFNYSVYYAGFRLPPIDSNAYYKIFGNSSLEMSANNTNSLTTALDIVSTLESINNTLVVEKLPSLSRLTVDSSPSGFQNLSITLKQVQPQVIPQSATVTLYSNGDANFYSYDLTSQLSNTSNIGQWTNITLTLGPNAAGWRSSGAPEWSNITALKLDFTYPTRSNITIEVGALFFHGQYLLPLQPLERLLLQFSSLFLVCWLALTGLFYLSCKVLKNSVLWKPLFIALGFAMTVLVIRAIVNLAAALTLPVVYYPFDLSLGATFNPFSALYYPIQAISPLFATSQAIFHSIDAATSPFRTIVSGMFVVSYVWLGALGTFVIGELKPKFTTVKRIAISAIVIVATILVLLLVFPGVA